MLSPASEHKSKLASGAASGCSTRTMKGDDVIIMAFQTDLNRMPNIRSRQRRNQTKAEVLPRYHDWINEIIQSTGMNHNRQTMFVWLLLWRADAGDWLGALSMLPYAVSEGMTAPFGFARTLPEAATEQIVDGINGTDNQALYVALLEDLHSIVSGEDLADEINAKLHKALGLAYLAGQPDKALEHLQTAIGFNPRVGVKRIIDKLQPTKASKKKAAPKKAKQADVKKLYQLSARAAAARLGVSTPTIIRHAKKSPEALPHLKIPTGTRCIFRFSSADVDNYKRKHLIHKVEVKSNVNN